MIEDEPGKNPTSDSELPTTATNMFNWLFAGVIVIVLGGALLVVQRIRHRDGKI